MQIRRILLMAAASAALVGCSRRVDVVSGGEVEAVVPVNANTLPAGSVIHARLNQALSTERSKVGDSFTLTVTNNVVAQNGDVVVPAGATIRGYVRAVDDSDDPTDRALIQLQFDQLSFGGRNYPFGASVQSVATVEQRNRQSGDVLKRTATGAAIGAAIGAIISGADLDAIIKGGAVGAAAGTVIGLGVGDVDHVIPEGTAIAIRSTQTVAIR
jgi:fatty acid-binding protein DegV